MDDMVVLKADFFDQTTLHPVALAALVLLSLAMLALPRRWALVPMLVMACFISQAQRVVILTLDFDLLRIMVMAGWMRVIMRSEAKLRWQPLDSWLTAWVMVSAAAMTLLHGDLATFKNRLGFVADALGMYFLFRVLVRDQADVVRLAKVFVVLALPVSIAFMLEWFSGRNVFSVFGCVPYQTVVRDGRLRCQGAFSHPILAGCFWASLTPLMAALWYRGGGGRLWCGAGLAAATLIIFATASSTPVMALALAATGTLFFPLRRHLRWMRWSLLGVLLALHLLMKAPVWHLVSRIDLAGGSTGWQRFHLIDAFIRHFGDWWLLGRRVYMYGWGDDLYDITNYYVMQGLQGGIVALALLLFVIGIAFRTVGRSLRRAGEHQTQRRLVWALGVTLLVHAANFMAVTYFGQITLLWYLSLALIATAGAMRPAVRRKRVVRVVADQPAEVKP